MNTACEVLKFDVLCEFCRLSVCKLRCHETVFNIGEHIHVVNKFRDLSEISRGEGGWKQRGGHNFLSLRKGRGHEKWAVKRGRVFECLTP